MVSPPFVHRNSFSCTALDLFDLALDSLTKASKAYNVVGVTSF